MSILTDEEKAFDQIQHPFIKNAQQKGIERIFFNIVKAIYEKP